jgi:hypothetical protein
LEAVLSWLPDSNLRSEAEGAQLHLASHVVDAVTGEMVLFDGPRAPICLGPNSDISVLPLPAPDLRSWNIQIDPVVELRFWSSQRGYQMLILECERNANGSVWVSSPATGQQFLVESLRTESFQINAPYYGLGDSERCIEIPWALSRVRSEQRVLDLGHANAEPRYVRARNALGIPVLVGLDPAAVAQDGSSA